MHPHPDSFACRRTLVSGGRDYDYFSLPAAAAAGLGEVAQLPVTLRILLENLLRHHWLGLASSEDIDNLASWQPDAVSPEAIPFMPSRVILQDFTGVPALVDLAAMRSALARHGGDPATTNPVIPADVVGSGVAADDPPQLRGLAPQ